MLERVLEPEVMDSDAEAHDYDAMDHAEVNRRFVADLVAFYFPPGPVLDVGTGTAQIVLELARQAPTLQIQAIDASAAMLRVAQANVERAGMGDRIRLVEADARRLPHADSTFAAVISNSIVHHIPEPVDMLREAWRLVKAGRRLFVRDLERPASDARVAELVATYAPIPDAAPAERAMHVRQRGLFEASLRAALTVDEVRALVGPLGVPAAAVTTTSDRHWTLSCVKP
jgi:ubiquinone/menaquinone biosynthesis C-methylase UbiE